jgi:1-acyl-sn-glycerol-3-phosphate acyltransferase
MSAAVQVSVPKAGLSALPRAIWRLGRVVLHVLNAYVRSHLVWPHLDEAGRHHEALTWSRQLLHVLGMTLHVEGIPHAGAKLVVANHVSWLDIVAINSVLPSRFVSKAEVGQWPVVGRLVTGAGTLYLARERRRDAMRVLGLMSQALSDGHTVAVFPEGTTGTGHEVMHLHPNLLQASIDAQTPIQPVLLRYSDPAELVSPLVAYVGDTSLMQSLWWVVTARGLRVHVEVLAPQACAHTDRRALSELLQVQLGDALSRNLQSAKPV